MVNSASLVRRVPPPLILHRGQPPSLNQGVTAADEHSRRVHSAFKETAKGFLQ